MTIHPLSLTNPTGDGVLEEVLLTPAAVPGVVGRGVGDPVLETAGHALQLHLDSSEEVSGEQGDDGDGGGDDGDGWMMVVNSKQSSQQTKTG